jgi:hypothetical protein
MLRALAFVPLLFLAASGGCGGPSPSTGPQEAQAGDTILLATGEALTVGGYALRFVDVVEDSRCPEDVTCVWGGRAKARFAISGPDEEAVTRVLTLPYPEATDDEPATWKTGDVSVTFLDLLAPSPESDALHQAEVRVDVADG